MAKLKARLGEIRRGLLSSKSELWQSVADGIAWASRVCSHRNLNYGKADVVLAIVTNGYIGFAVRYNTLHFHFSKDQLRLLPVIREKKRLKPRSSIAQALDFRC